jgi:primosomal replication protein N
MNRVFMTGKVEKRPEIVYTPRGEKFMLFPLRVTDGDFLIDIECRGDASEPYADAAIGSSVMVSGMLVRKKLAAKEIVKLKANKIFWMEE